MKELLEHIVKSIVNHPDDVIIEEKKSVDFPGLTILTITVNEEDKGIIIGRKGRTINSIRDIIKISAIRNKIAVTVMLNDDEEGRSQQNMKIEETTDQDILDDEV